MAGPFAKVPPLRSLIAFEAAARYGKFAAAAAELNMTQAAVSQHIAQLEADVGAALFDRQHRGVVLTSAGTALLHSVESGLTELAEGAAAVRRRGAKQVVRIRTDFGFASWWLMPRIAALNAELPDVEIHITTAQADIRASDKDFDLAILFGHGDWHKCRATKLCDEEVYPVCAPAYLSGRSLPASPQDILQMRLLHLHSEVQGRWFDWDDWFSAAGIRPGTPKPGSTFSNFQLVLQAVLMGQGVAIGFTPLIDDLVASGLLVKLSETPLRSDRGYYVVAPDTGVADRNVRRVRDWLIDALPFGSAGALVMAS